MTRSHRIQLLAVVLFILMVLGLVLFILPMQRANKALQLDKREAVAERQEAQLSLEKLSQLSDELSASESTKKALLRAVPSGLSQDALILELKELADEADFNVNNMSFSERNSEGLGEVLSVGLSLAGDYSDLTTLLELIEEADRLMEVSSISVQRIDPQSILFNLTVEAFYQ